MWWFFLVVVALAQDEAVELAPSVADLRAVNDRLAEEVAIADLLADVVGATHNSWVEAGAASSCEGGVAARSAVFGTAWRDVVQRARRQVRVAEVMSQNPLLSPVLTGSDNADRLALAARVVLHERQLAESRQWHARYMAPLTRRCGDVLLAYEAPQSRSSPAVFAWSGEGVLCLDGQPSTEAQAVVISDQRACVAQTDLCSCSAQGVLSGSVLTASVTE